MTTPNQAYQITGRSTLTLTDLGPLPTPKAHQVLIRLAAFALNYRDKLVISHSPDYPIRAGPNLIPGCDAAGTVETAGSDSRWQKGDRVVVHPNTWLHGTDGRDWKFEETMGGGSVDGTFRRWMVVGDEYLIRAPESLPLEESAGMFTAGVTAWRALMHGGVALRPGVTVLTQGTGGVSSYGILVSVLKSECDSADVLRQIAVAIGATVIATSSSDEKLEVARQLGATHLINYAKHADWSSKVLKATNGEGVDLVLDVVGAQSMEQTIKATTFGGKIIVTGLLSKDPNQKIDIMTDVLYGAKTCMLPML